MTVERIQTELNTRPTPIFEPKERPASDEYRTDIPLLEYAADPDVIFDPLERKVHLLTTQSGDGYGNFVYMPHYVSDDGVNFKFIGDAMPSPPEWADNSDRQFFGPSQLDGQIVYFSAKKKESKDFAIGIATRKNHFDRLTPLPEPIAGGRGGYSDIDPDAFRLPDGRVELIWGSGSLPIVRNWLSPDGLNWLQRCVDVVIDPIPHIQYKSLIESPQRLNLPDANGKTQQILIVSGHDTAGHINFDPSLPYGESYAISAYIWTQGKNGIPRFKEISEVYDYKDSVIFRGNAEAGIVNVGHPKFIFDQKGKLWCYYTAIDLTDCGPERISDFVKRKVYLEPVGIDANGIPFFENGMPVKRTVKKPDF